MLHLRIGILEGLGKFRIKKYASCPGNSVFGTPIFVVLSSPEAAAQHPGPPDMVAVGGYAQEIRRGLFPTDGYVSSE